MKKNTCVKKNNYSSNINGNKNTQTTFKSKYKNDCNIPNSIFELFVSLFKFNKEINDKILNKDYKSEMYYLINYDFLDNIKKVYNYKSISQEIEKCQYNNDKDIIKLIKEKKIIKEKVSLDDIDIVAKTLSFFGTLHNVNFTIINEKIYSTIKQIQQDFNLTKGRKVLKYQFFFRPQLFYRGKSFIKIGHFDKNFIFEIQYFIKMDLMKGNSYSIVSEIISSKSVEDYFIRKNISIDSKASHDLIDCNIKVAEVINFSFKGQNNIIINTNDIPSTNKLRSNYVKAPTTNNNYNSSINSSYSTNFSNTTYLKSLDNFLIKKIEQIEFTPMIGLQNIGKTCYMNAALQCFSNAKALTSYFLNYNNLQYLKSNTIIMNESDEPSLVIEYLKLVRHLWCDPPKSAYPPHEFKKAIGKIDSLFKDFEANDAKDFVNFMVMRLHEELNGVDSHLTKQNNLTPPSNILNPYDQMQVLQSYLYEFQINFDSFISNCFYGTTQGEFECQNCKMQMY